MQNSTRVHKIEFNMQKKGLKTPKLKKIPVKLPFFSLAKISLAKMLRVVENKTNVYEVTRLPQCRFACMLFDVKRYVLHIKIAVLHHLGAFSEVFSWKRLKMSIYKLYNPNLEFS